jgi:hypothetical protein
VEHDYVISLNVEHPPKSCTRGYYSKRTLTASGFKSFSPCAHSTWVLHTVTERVDWHGVRSVRVAYALHNVLGQEFRDEWQSDVGRQPTNMSCGMCYTDFSMRFDGGRSGYTIEARLSAYKDLGRVDMSGMPDERWNAAAGSLMLQRPRHDFGRIRRFFQPEPALNVDC